MIFVNPFTGVILNANPKGDNQYSNPDGPSRRSVTPTRILPRLRNFFETSSSLNDDPTWDPSKGEDRYGGWILPSDDLVDAPQHAEPLIQAPTDFGIHDKVSKIYDRAMKKERLAHLPKLENAAIKRAISTGSIRVSSTEDSSQSAIQAGPGVSIDRIIRLIESKKVPKTKTYYVDTPDYNGSATLEDLYESRSFKHLARRKQFGA